MPFVRVEIPAGFILSEEKGELSPRVLRNVLNVHQISFFLSSTRPQTAAELHEVETRYSTYDQWRNLVTDLNMSAQDLNNGTPVESLLFQPGSTPELERKLGIPNDVFLQEGQMLLIGNEKSEAFWATIIVFYFDSNPKSR